MERIVIRKIENITSPVTTFYTYLLIVMGFFSQALPGILSYVLPALITMTIGLLNAIHIPY